jgi:hypothetical protein
MKKKILSSLLTFSMLLITNIAHADIVDDSTAPDAYKWEMSDTNQRKVASGMIMWGFLLAIASALISGLIPNSTGTTTTTTSS